MSRRKKFLIVILAIIGGIFTYASLLATFLGLVMLFEIPRPYTPEQPRDQIERIEICQHNEETHILTTLKTFEGQEQEAFLEELLQVPRQSRYGGQTDSVGEVVVCIYYKDHSTEVLGIWNNAKIDANGEWDIYILHMKSKEFCHLLLQYVDEDQVPEYYLN